MSVLSVIGKNIVNNAKRRNLSFKNLKNDGKILSVSQIERLRPKIYALFQKNNPVIQDFEPRDVFETVSTWFAKYHASVVCKFERPNRGIIIFGQVGCGKTTITRAFMKGPTYPNSKIAQWGIPFISSHKLSSEYRKSGDSWWGLFKETHSGDLIIDDIGSEEDSSWMGNKWSLGEVIKWRYELFKNKGSLTIISTNILDFESIGEYYSRRINDPVARKNESERISSRLIEMCSSLVYDYKNRRIEE